MFVTSEGNPGNRSKIPCSSQNNSLIASPANFCRSGCYVGAFPAEIGSPSLNLSKFPVDLPASRELDLRPVLLGCVPHHPVCCFGILQRLSRKARYWRGFSSPLRLIPVSVRGSAAIFDLWSPVPKFLFLVRFLLFEVSCATRAGLPLPGSGPNIGPFQVGHLGCARDIYRRSTRVRVASSAKAHRVPHPFALERPARSSALAMWRGACD